MVPLYQMEFLCELIQKLQFEQTHAHRQDENITYQQMWTQYREIFE